MIEKIILNLKEANWMEFPSADEKLRTVLRNKHRICKSANKMIIMNLAT